MMNFNRMQLKRMVCKSRLGKLNEAYISKRMVIFLTGLVVKSQPAINIDSRQH
jgi:hypothetical protein